MHVDMTTRTHADRVPFDGDTGKASIRDAKQRR
jgi:hypothetical protein